MNVKIFDKRVSKFVKTFYSVHKGIIHQFVSSSQNDFQDDIKCVEWSPNGAMIGTASDDSKAILLDFRTKKVLYTGSSIGKSGLSHLISSNSFNY